MSTIEIRAVDPFGPYVDDPTSLCFEKDIG